MIEGRQVEAFRDECCQREILYAHHSHFDLYGNFISGFCGGLTVGDWHELPELLDHFRAGDYPELIAILVEEGPYGLYTLAHSTYGYQPPADGFAGKCHLCVDVRRHLVRQGDFPELKPREFYERI
jgi:hypothetical protein